MSILDQLSSQIGDRTEAANRRVMTRVQQDAALLDEIVEGLSSSNAKLAGDCAEVMTMVAEKNPELLAPYADALIGQLDHTATRVRWEAMHCLAEVAPLVPDRISRLVRKLVEKIALDRSVIVRDHAIRTLGAYGSTSKAAARQVWPHLREALVLWEGKHVGKALEAMNQLVALDPTLKAEAQKIAKRFADHSSARVRTLAKRLLK